MVVEIADPSLPRGRHAHVQPFAIALVPDAGLCIEAHTHSAVRLQPQAELLKPVAVKNLHANVLTAVRHRRAEADSVPSLPVLDNQQLRFQHIGGFGAGLCGHQERADQSDPQAARNQAKPANSTLQLLQAIGEFR